MNQAKLGSYTSAMFRAARVAGPIAGALALTIAATIHPWRLHAQPASPSSPSITSPALVVQLSRATEHDRRRVHAAAQEAIDRLSEWLGRCPATSITLVDLPWRGAISTAASNVTLDVPWRSSPETMDLESQAAFGVARQWWPGLSADAEAGALVDGLSWYLQSRIVDRLFDFNFLMPAHSAVAVRNFGGAWPRAFQILPLGRWSGGLGREEYLRARLTRPSWPRLERRLPPGLTAKAVRRAIALATLEQMVGWPTLQGALRVLSEASVQRSIGRREAEQIIAAAVGQDLSWFFRVAFDDSASIDYAVRELITGNTSPCGNGPCVRTRVTVARSGDGQFTGSSETAATAFEAGDAIELRVTFADGQQASARWDGRAVSRTFEFDSASPAVSAVVDPDRILLLDENALNNAMRTDVATNDVVRKWIAYWVVWLEGAALNYTGLF